MDLNIHLDRGNTFGSTGYLKVHISEEVFQSLDIGQQNEIVIGLAGYQGTPAAIRDMQEAQVDAMEVDPLDSKVSDTVRIA